MLERDPNVIMMLLLDGSYIRWLDRYLIKRQKRVGVGDTSTVLVLRPREHAPRCVKAREIRGIYRQKDCTLSKSRNCSGTWKEPPGCRSLLSSCTGSYKADIVSSRSPDGHDPGAGKRFLFLYPQHPPNTASHDMSKYLPRLQSWFYPERESTKSIGRSGSTGSVTRSPHLTTSPPSAVACVYKNDHKTIPSTCIISVRLEERRRSLKATLSDPKYPPWFESLLPLTRT